MLKLTNIEEYAVTTYYAGTIEDDKGNELINKALTCPVSEANTEFSVLVTLTDEEIQTLSAAGDKDKQCKITIKTTIGDTTSTRKIGKNSQ